MTIPRFAFQLPSLKGPGTQIESIPTPRPRCVISPPSTRHAPYMSASNPHGLVGCFSDVLGHYFMYAWDPSCFCLTQELDNAPEETQMQLKEQSWDFGLAGAQEAETGGSDW